jgi:hypothetical protein
VEEPFQRRADSGILKEQRAGYTVASLGRKHGIGDAILMAGVPKCRGAEFHVRLAAQHRRKVDSKQDGHRRTDAEQGPTGLVIKAIGLAQAKLKIGSVQRRRRSPEASLKGSRWR